MNLELQISLIKDIKDILSNKLLLQFNIANSNIDDIDFNIDITNGGKINNLGILQIMNKYPDIEKLMSVNIQLLENIYKLYKEINLKKDKKLLCLKYKCEDLFFNIRGCRIQDDFMESKYNLFNYILLPYLISEFEKEERQEKIIPNDIDKKHRKLLKEINNKYILKRQKLAVILLFFISLLISFIISIFSLYISGELFNGYDFIHNNILFFKIKELTNIHFMFEIFLFVLVIEFLYKKIDDILHKTSFFFFKKISQFKYFIFDKPNRILYKIFHV